MTQLEKDLEQRCRTIAERLGGMLLKLECKNEKGWPDRTLILNGEVSFLEFKKPGGRLSPHQIRMRRRLGEAKTPVDVVPSIEKFRIVVKALHDITEEQWNEATNSTTTKK